MFKGAPVLSLLTIGLCGLNTSCSTYGVPSLNHGILMRNPPRVVDLVQHIDCEIAQAMAKESKNSLWQHLWDENFVASVDLTLTATNAEGFNPSLNWIVPTNSLGKEISLPGPPPGQTGMSSMFNRGLAVGVQANGTQDRNFDVTYNIDMSRLHHAVLRAMTDAELKERGSAPDLTFICGDSSASDPTAVHTKKPEYSGLQGKLGLKDTIDWGLEAIDAGRVFAVYGNSGPVTRGDENVPPPAPQTEEEAEKQRVSAVLAAAALPPSGKQGGGAQTGGSSFSSKIDFTIVEGLNGGPSWSLLKWKIAGGAGGGGGGGGGGGAGGGGAGGGQMLNWNRTVLDSLVITLAPTCSSVVERLDESTESKASPAGTLQWAIPKIATKDPLVYRIYTLDEPAWPTDSGAFTLNKGQIRVIERVSSHPIGSAEFGTIEWNGFAFPALNAEGKEAKAAERVELRGSIVDPITGNPVGVITLYHGSDGKAYGNISPGLYERLSDHEPTPDYWASLQSCELVTPTQKQSLMDRAQQTNNLFKLNNTQRQRLLQ